MDFVRHIREEYAPGMGWRNVRQSDNDERMVLAERGERRVVVTVKLVGQPNSGAYRHWATLHKNHYLAIAAERPANREYFTLMVGMLENDEPWWSALWSEAGIKRHIEAAEEMENGRWYRCRPDLFPGDIVDTYDFIQPALGLGEPKEEVEVVVAAKESRRVESMHLQTKTVLDLIREMRQQAREGKLIRQEADHRATNPKTGRTYNRLSTRRINIAASYVTSLNGEWREVEYDDAWDIMTELAFGK